MIKITLKANRDKPVRTGHPWIFSGAIARIEGRASAGEMCTVLSSSGAILGCGYYNPASSISVRMLSLGTDQFTLETLLHRIDLAASRRRSLFLNDGNSYRLVNSEGDFLPGLIVDKYGAGLCIQVLTAGMEMFRDSIIAHLAKTLKPDFIFERSDTDARTREGLVLKNGLVYGSMPDQAVLRENGLSFRIDLCDGQKTGFFLDQRCNRLLSSNYAEKASVCDCFAYSGGFSVYALSHGARLVHAVDISAKALATAKRNVELNGLSSEKVTFIEDDVFTFLRRTETSYNMIILDPPKFAKHPGEVERASRGYKDINLLAFKRAAPEGIVFTFSCSNAIEPRLFRQIVFSAATDSGRRIQVLHVLSAAPDHPVNIAHLEGDYLKGLVLRVE